MARAVQIRGEGTGSDRIPDSARVPRAVATIFRALMTAVLLLCGWAAWLGLSAADDAARAGHVSAGFITSLLAALVQSLPFAYFLGTGFWVRAFARASRAGPLWEERHKQWMKSRAYPVMYLPPALTLLAALSGIAAGAGHAPAWLHGLLAAGATLATLGALVLVPAEMQRNSALMDELAARHQVPRPATPEYERLVAEEEQHALPALFQLSRVVLFASAQLVVVWLYLRFGTEGWRTTPFAPFGVGAVVLLTLGLALNDMHDPQRPAPPARAWRKALAVGGACGAALVALLILG